MSFILFYSLQLDSEGGSCPSDSPTGDSPVSTLNMKKSVSVVTLQSQKRHRLDASCGFYRPDAICQKVVSRLLTSLLQVCEHQTCCNLIFADLLQVDETTYIKPACSSRLAASLLTTCKRLVIIKPEQAMRMHPDIGMVIADMLQLAFLAVYTTV